MTGIARLPEANKQEVAVVINHHARKVSGRVVRRLSEVAGSANLYYSRSLEEARAFIHEIVERRYAQVFSGGGDGSLTALINMIREYVDLKNRELDKLRAELRQRTTRYQLPNFGILKLGTGNGWGTAVGIRRGVEQLRRVIGEGYQRLSTFNLIASGDQVFPFSGLGWDAAILNDFLWLRERLRTRTSKWLLGGLLGYLTATFLRTVPKEMIRRSPRVEIINAEGKVIRVANGRRPAPLPIGPGEVIYRGPANVIGVSTTTNYGFGLRAFPFARLREGHMQLRVVRAGVPEILAKTAQIWHGTYRGRNFLDFLVRHIKIRFDREMPLQIGGDAMGYHREMDYRISGQTVAIYDFS